MARYIDADKLIAHLKDEIKECEIPFGSRANGKGVTYGTALGLKAAMSFAQTLAESSIPINNDILTDCNFFLSEFQARITSQMSMVAASSFVQGYNMAKSNQVLYRPQKSSLDEAMEEMCAFPDLETMFEYLVRDHDNAFNKDEIYVSYYCYDDRIDWSTYIVTTTRYGNEVYDYPQAIGFCTFKKYTEKNKNE